MRKRLIILLLICISNLIYGQRPSGLWILTHVKALQPVYTMVEIDGVYEIVDEDPQDSTYLYNSGLMTIEFQNKKGIISHSWDGKEEWTMDQNDDILYLYGQRDTLYGEYTDESLILRSTLDDRPTYYNFSPLPEKKFSTPRLLTDKWTVSSENELLNNLEITFTTDSSYQIATGKSINSQVYFTYNLDNLAAIEYDFPPQSDQDDSQELGTIYLFETRKKVVKGVFYPITDGVNVPEKSELTLIKK